MKDIQLVNFANTTKLAYLATPVNNGYVTGTDYLVQKITKRILTEKGTNGFESSVGSTFHKLLGSADSYDSAVLETYVNVAVKELLDDLKSEQSLLEDDDATLSNDEKIYDISVSTVTYDPLTTKWTIILDILTESNKSIKIQVPLTI